MPLPCGAELFGRQREDHIIQGQWFSDGPKLEAQDKFWQCIFWVLPRPTELETTARRGRCAEICFNKIFRVF